MERNDWRLERWRVLLALALGLLGGAATGYWLASLTLASMGYSGWMLFKLWQLHRWLESGARPSGLPDSTGIWERIGYFIQRASRQSALGKKRISQELKRSQRIIKSLPYATVVLNGANEIEWANHQSAELLRLDPKRDRGQRLENLVRSPRLFRLLEENRAREIEIASPANHQVRLAVQLLPLQRDMRLLLARDISERVRVQQMRKTFIANASHELRTPLMVIAGYLEILRDDETLPENLRPAVDAASEQASRMQRIIEDLLTLSRLENSELEENDSDLIDMAAMIRRVVADESALEGGGRPIDESALDERFLLRGAESEIASVCVNLIHNAFRYTPAEASVAVAWRRLPTGEGSFRVVDSGDGIPPEHIPHLTERFYRVDSGRSRASGGTGLGLAIVQHVVQRHGGRLLISSEMGEGSVFEAVFPADRIVARPTGPENPANLPLVGK